MDGIELHGLTAGYGGSDVLRDIELTVEPGQCVVLLGPNGAGKSTMLRVISGQVKPSSGKLLVDGGDFTGKRPYKLARAGVRWLGDPKPIYWDLSIEDNLQIGGITKRQRSVEQAEMVYELFPVLAERRKQSAGSLSGGQQQMLAIGQALMSDPRYILFDEPSLGLAAQLVQLIAEKISGLAAAGVGVLWAEQFPEVAMKAADRVVVLGAGVILAQGPPGNINQAILDAAYLGHPIPPEAKVAADAATPAE